MKLVGQRPNPELAIEQKGYLEARNRCHLHASEPIEDKSSCISTDQGDASNP